MASERVQRQIDRLLDEAENAISGQDWQLVQDCAQAVLGLDPDNIDADAFLASAKRVLQSRPKALVEQVPGTVATDTSSDLPISTQATPDQPTSFSNGRYQVKRFLGEGGEECRGRFATSQKQAELGNHEPSKMSCKLAGKKVV